MRLPFALIVALLLSLTACAAPATNGDAQPHADAAHTAPAASAPVAQAPQAKPDKPMRTGGPLPADPVEPAAPKGGTPVAVDFSCKRDADCAVKNVGNCCGYYPACVNRDSPTDPQGVQAQCAKKGMMSVCGFQEISSCSCQAGRCEGSSANLNPVVQ